MPIRVPSLLLNVAATAAAAAVLCACNLVDPGVLEGAPNLSASSSAPIYSTYAAATERSFFLLDEGYAWPLSDSIRGARFVTDSAGDLGVSLFLDGKATPAPGSADAPVSIAESYSDMVRYSWDAAPLAIDASFLVYSSRAAVWDLVIRNEGSVPVVVGIRPWLAAPDSGWTGVGVTGATGATDDDIPAVTARHAEPADAWTVAHDVPHVSDVATVFAATADGEWLSPANRGADTLALETMRTLAPNAATQIRILRVVEPASDSTRVPEAHHAPRTTLHELATLNLAPILATNRRWLSALNLERFESRDERLLYLSAANLMRQSFYPPEGKSSYRWYVFAREPTWGWGHGGQVFHESLTMLALARVDPLLAFESQFVYEERQHQNGYINYRTGAYLDEVIEYDGALTSSAPWYAWINAELHRISAPRVDAEIRHDFLARMYPSSKRFYEFFVANRDRDGDGLAEWGGHAVLESVRDSEVAVWDEVGWPSNFEGLDVNAMLVREERALAYMAGELGLAGESAEWTRRADARAELMNATMWDEVTGFYYHVRGEGVGERGRGLGGGGSGGNASDSGGASGGALRGKSGGNFSFRSPDDLKRREIIGFLPLWAGVADSARAARLVEHLTDPAQFWRANGVPTLAADDPYYNPRGYWNGPVWVQWNYLVWRGLMDYGYHAEADTLAERVRGAMIERLRGEHTLYELYDPDSNWGGRHAPYIWAGIIVGMMEE